MPVDELVRRSKQAETLRNMIKHAEELGDDERVARLRATLKETDALLTKLRGARREERTASRAGEGS